MHLYAGELELSVHVGTDSTPSFPRGSVPDSHACASACSIRALAIINYFGLIFLGSSDKVRQGKDNPNCDRRCGASSVAVV